MPQRSEETAAGEVARAGVDAHLEPVGMQPVTQALDVRELLVRDDTSVRGAFRRLPGVVDVHVAIAVVRQAPVDEGGGRGHHLLLRDAQAPAVPGVPAHRRRQGDLRAHLQGELRPGLALRVAGDENQRIVAGLVDAAAQDAFVRIQGNPFRKAFHGIFHRFVTREGQPEDDRRTGTDAEHQRSVIARGGRGRRGEDVRGCSRRFQRLSELVIGICHRHPLVSLGRDLEGEVRPGRQRNLPFLFVDDLVRQDILRDDLHGAARSQRRMNERLVPVILPVQRQGNEILQNRLSDEDRTGIETARIAAIVHTDGDDVLLVPLDEFRCHDIAPGNIPCLDKPLRVFRVQPHLPYPDSVHPGFVRIVDRTEVQHDLVRRAFLQGRRDDDMDTVPAITVRIRYALLVPVLLQREDLPAAVVERSLAPGGIVPLLETAFRHGDDLGFEGKRTGQPKHGHNQQSSHKILYFNDFIHRKASRPGCSSRQCRGRKWPLPPRHRRNSRSIAPPAGDSPRPDSPRHRRNRRRPGQGPR